MAEEVCRCFCYLSFADEYAKTVIESGNILLGIHAVYRKGLCSKAATEMIAIIIKNLTCNGSVCQQVVEQDGVKLLRSLMDNLLDSSAVMSKAVVLVLLNLTREKHLHESIIQQGFTSMLQQITIGRKHAENTNNNNNSFINAKKHQSSQQQLLKSDEAPHTGLSQATILNIVSAIELISETKECRAALVEGNIIQIFKALLNDLDHVSKHEMSCAIANMASSRECRDSLVEQEVVDLLISLADTPYIQTRSQCSLALGYLSEYTKVKRSTVASMLLLSLKAEEQGVGYTEPPLGHKEFDMKYVDRSRAANNRSAHGSANGPNSKESTLAQGGTKSLRLMIKDGLMRHKDEHGILLDEPEKKHKNPSIVSTASGPISSAAAAASKGGAGGGGSSNSSVNPTDHSALNISRRESMTSPSRRESAMRLHSANNTVQRSVTEVEPSVGEETMTLDDTNDDISLSEQVVHSIEMSNLGDESDEDDEDTDFNYDFAEHTTNQEAGGMAKKQKVELPYPELPDGRYLEPPDRQKELYKIPVVMTTLPKDLSVVDISKTSSEVVPVDAPDLSADNSPTAGGYRKTSDMDSRRDRYGRKHSKPLNYLRTPSKHASGRILRHHSNDYPIGKLEKKASVGKIMLDK